MNRNAPMTSPELDLLNFIGFLSDLTCTKKYVLTEAPKRGGELMWATRSAPPPSQFMLATSLRFQYIHLINMIFNAVTSFAES